MLPTGIPSLALISAYGRGGSWSSRPISRWPPDGRSRNASRSAAFRSAASSSCSAAPAWSSGRVSASSAHPVASGLPARRTRWHSRRVVVASQPGSAAGSCRLPRCPYQVQPDGLADVLGVSAAQPMPTADRPDQRGVPLDECVPRLLLAVLGARHQVGYGQVIAHRVAVPSCRCPAAARVRPRACLIVRRCALGADSPLTA